MTAILTERHTYASGTIHSILIMAGMMFLTEKTLTNALNCSVITNRKDDHAHKGAELARVILGELKLTDENETDIICSAIYHHDDKHVVDGPMDEVLKDADVVHHCMNDLAKEVKEKEKSRYESICNEFGLK